MSIDTSGVEAVFRFNSKTHIMVYDGENWTINPRIDRSYNGKEDDVGTPVVYLTEQEAEALKKSGFSYMEI